MKVALVGPVYPLRGGIAHYTALLAQQLGQAHDTRVYSYKQLYPAWLFPGRSQTDPSSTPTAPLQARPWLVAWQPHTWRKVAFDWSSWQPDVLIVQWWVPFMAPMTAWLLAAARRYHIPVVVICHNVLPHERRWFDRPLVRLALRQVDCLIVHSAEERQAAQALFPNQTVELAVMPRQTLVTATTDDRDQARAALQISGRIILFFGFVRPYKGLPDLLAAMPQVVAECGARLLVVGEIWGSDEPYVNQVRHLGLEPHVRFVNRYVTNEEAARFFAAADVAVLPYRHSTGSAAAQLAYSLGVPVIATRTGSLGEVVEEGVTGFLVAPGDVHGLAGAIVRFFQENRAAAFRTAIAQRHRDFGWHHLIQLIEAGAAAGAVRAG